MTDLPTPVSRWRRLTSSVRARLVGSVAALSALGLAGSGAVALVVERERVDARVKRSVAQEVREFAEFAGGGIDPRTGRQFIDAESVITAAMQQNVPGEHEVLLGYLPGLTIVPVDGGGALQGDSAFRSEATARNLPGFGRYHSAKEGRIVYAVMPFTKDGRLNHFVSAYFVDLEMAELDGTIRSYAVVATLTWAALVLAASALARRVLRPLDDLRRTAETITETDVSQRIDVTGADEVAELGETVNGMLDRLEEALHSQRHMLDDAGHELRTPVTVIRGHLELMDAQEADDVEDTRALVIDELDRMGRIIEDLLMLAKARRPDFLRREVVDIGEVVATTLEKASGLAPRSWVLDSAPEVMVPVDASRLAQALLQLAANAVAVTSERDTIAFGCAPVLGAVRIWVRDSGPGVPAADRHRIFARFETGGAGSTGGTGSEGGGTGSEGGGTGSEGGGTGLGLAIVAAIADAHGGRVEVAAASPEGGALFTLELPAPHASPPLGGSGTLTALVDCGPAQATR
ncbi:MAG: ATP-binding protein [Dermatophilaceae bacterium]